MIFKFKDASGSAVSLTGKTLTVTAKKSLADTDAQSVFQKIVTSHTDANGGISAINLTTQDTSILGSLYIDAVLTGGGDIKTLFVGSLTITKGVKDA